MASPWLVRKRVPVDVMLARVEISISHFLQGQPYSMSMMCLQETVSAIHKACGSRRQHVPEYT